MMPRMTGAGAPPAGTAARAAAPALVTPVLMVAAHKLRAGWRGWAALAALIAVAGGAVLAAAAGAVRTDTAYPRFLAASNASDVLVAPAESGAGYDAALAALPGVAASAPVNGLNALPLVNGIPDEAATTVTVPDGRYGHLVDVPRMLAGRLPAAGAAGEVAVDQAAAARLHLRVGSALPMAVFDNSAHPRPRPLTERVVGVFVSRGSVVPVTYTDQVAVILGSAALYREFGPAYAAYDGAYVKLRPGASLAVFSAAAQALTRRYPASGGQAFVSDEATQATAVERAIRPQAVTLALFALALGLTALLIIGQAATRLVAAAAADNGALAALGMGRRQLFAAALLETGAAALGGALGAVAVAVAASPLTPIGPARLAEPDPGVSVDGPVLATGFAAIVALLLARVAVTAWRQAAVRPATAGGAPGRAPAAGRPQVAAALARAGAPLPVVAGVRLALDPGGRGPAAGRGGGQFGGALLGIVVAVTAVAAAVTFGASLLRLVDTPRLYGQDWDIALEGQFGTVTAAQFDKITGPVPGIAGVTFGVHGTVTIGREVIPAIGLAAGTGPPMSSTVLAGRPPAAPDEIALGASVLRQAGLRVGQEVTVALPGGRRRMLITGSAVFPYFGQGGFTPTDAGQGAEVTATVLAPQSRAAVGAGYNFALVRFTPGAAKAADMAAFQRAWQPFCAQAEQSTCLVTDQRPNTVSNYAAIDATPAVLATVLAVLGTGVLAQFTVASARRRRRDYAVLKVIGMTHGGLRAVSLCQAAVVTVAALAIGIPLGVAGGRWAWALFAGQAGLPAGAVTPLPVLWMIPATVAVALLVAAPTARSVARLPAAAALRAE